MAYNDGGSNGLPDKVTYKRPDLLKSYLDENLKINSRRRTHLSSPAQRQLTKEIKRARFMALLPYVEE